MMPDPKPTYTVVSRPNGAVLDLSSGRSVPTVPYTRVSRPNGAVLDLSVPTDRGLELTVADTNGPAPVRERVRKLLAALNDYETALGGAGVAVREAVAAGTVTFTLTPNDPAGAADRLPRLAAVLAGAVPEATVRW
jgi:hypothetical protein